MAAEPSKALPDQYRAMTAIQSMGWHVVSREVIVQGPTLMVVSNPLKKAQDSKKVRKDEQCTWTIVSVTRQSAPRALFFPCAVALSDWS